MAQVQNFYETVFVLSTKNGDEAVAALSQKFKDLISENGTIDGVEEWGKRRLAYMIDKQTEGYYVLVYFTAAPEFTAELDRIYGITDGVMRWLTTKREERFVPKAPKAEAPAAEPAAPAVEAPVAAEPEAPAVEAEKTEE